MNNLKYLKPIIYNKLNSQANIYKDIQQRAAEEGKASANKGKWETWVVEGKQYF